MIYNKHLIAPVPRWPGGGRATTVRNNNCCEKGRVDANHRYSNPRSHLKEGKKP